MPVIGHQAEGADPHGRGLDGPGQHAHERGVVAVITEQPPPPGGTVEHVINNAAGRAAGLPWHGGKGSRGAGSPQYWTRPVCVHPNQYVQIASSLASDLK